MERKQRILEALRKFVSQRAGLEFDGDVSAYRSEQRSITQDRHHAERIISSVEWRDSITADEIIAQSKRAFSGRLTIIESGDKVTVDYCIGHYFPTEYRKAVAALMASCLWANWRDYSLAPKTTGNSIRAIARQNFGKAIANRYFH